MAGKALIHHATGLRTIGMVRQLVMLGFGIGLVCLLSFIWFLYQMNQASVQLEALEARFSRLTSTFNIALADAHRDMKEHLDHFKSIDSDSDNPWQDRLTKVISEMTDEKFDNFTNTRSGELMATARDLIDQYQHLIDVQHRIGRNNLVVEKRYGQVVQLLDQMHEQIALHQGQRLLAHARMIRHFLGHPQDQSLDKASDLINRMRDLLAMDDLDMEFLELSMIVEKIHNDKDIVSLADLLNNHLKSVLDRFNGAIHHLPPSTWLDAFDRQIKQFVQLVSQPADMQAHGQAASVGLLPVKEQQVRLGKELARIDNQIKHDSDVLNKLQDDMALQSTIKTEQVWDMFQRKGRDNFIQTSMIMIVCWITFLILASLIIKSIRQQVEKQQLTETDLYQQVQERIEAQQKTQEIYQQLTQVHKLESIGQLAAGIAHEINTPSQYVSDNTKFLKTSFEALKQVHDLNRQMIEGADDSELVSQCVAQIHAAITTLEIEELWEEIPHAIDQSIDGIQHVAEIVESLRQFAHAGNGQKLFYDVNKLVKNAITISRNEWKYISQLRTDFADHLPMIPVSVSQFSQAVLGMIVNASHAIAQRQQEQNLHKGLIMIRTRLSESSVQIIIEDNGEGIPPENRDRIFDPFFTTRPVGKGAGQGLALAYATVVDQHKGQIHVESELNVGTTFTITLPIVEPAAV